MGIAPIASEANLVPTTNIVLLQTASWSSPVRNATNVKFSDSYESTMWPDRGAASGFIHPPARRERVPLRLIGRVSLTRGFSVPGPSITSFNEDEWEPRRMIGMAAAFNQAHLPRRIAQTHCTAKR